MNDKIANTAELSRMGELCVLMEGLCHVLATRDDITACRLLERYRTEFNSLCTEVLPVTDVTDPAPAEVVDEAAEAPQTTTPASPLSAIEDDPSVPAEAPAVSEAPATQDIPAASDPAVVSPTPAAELRVDEMLTRREARELRNAFTLNDKFRFRRELFDNDNDKFRDALRMLEAMSDYDEALTYMRDDLGWDMDAEAAVDFAAIVANHFAVV